MTLLNRAARSLISSGRLAHLSTIDPDGSPQMSAVWVGLDGDEIVTAHLMGGRKVGNIARDPRVALTMEADGDNGIGMRDYLIVRGTARLQEGGAPELLQELATVYIGPGVKFPPMDQPPPGHVIRITPTRVGGSGPWA